MGRLEEPNDQVLVKAVRISCKGERKAGVPIMTQCNIPRDHVVFREGDTSEVSKLIGIPFQVCKVWSGAQLSDPTSVFIVELGHRWNAEAGEIMNQLNRGFSKHFEKGSLPFRTPGRWLGSIGSVLVARTDRKPLYPHHLRLLIQYMSEVASLAKLMIPYNAYGTLAVRMLLTEKTAPSAKDVLACINPHEFKEYYIAQCNLDQSLCYPTPWSWPPSIPVHYKRQSLRRDYADLSLKDKFEISESWKERLLLNEIHSLQYRLEQGKQLGDIQRKRRRSENTSNDEVEQGTKRQRLEEC